MENKYDYLIVGQGLTGSIFSFTASLERKNAIVIASKNYPASSKVAVGIINSMVIKRLTKSWRSDEFNVYLEEFYPKIEKYLNEKLLYKTRTLKPISSTEEEKFWTSRSKIGNMAEYISDQTAENQLPKCFKWNRTAEIFRTYRLEVKRLLKAYSSKLKEKGLLIEEDFDYSQLKFNNGFYTYKNIKAKNIVFCEGIHANKNPFFKYLPFSPNKGEILTVQTKNLDPEIVINKKIFIFPLGQDHYKIGSSYEWEKLDNNPTEEKKAEIENNFRQMCSAHFNTVEQEAGIRPSTKDRRPFLGEHPKQDNMYILNGMGAKAALMAPLLAKELFEYIENGASIGSECSIERYENLYQIDSLE